MLHFLKKNRNEIDAQNIEWDSKEMKSRQIQKVPCHEKCEFPYLKRFEDDQLAVIEGQKKGKKKPKTEDEKHDEYSFDESELDYSINENEEDDMDEHWGQEENEPYNQREAYSGTGGNANDESSDGRGRPRY